MNPFENQTHVWIILSLDLEIYIYHCTTALSQLSDYVFKMLIWTIYVFWTTKTLEVFINWHVLVSLFSYLQQVGIDKGEIPDLAKVSMNGWSQHSLAVIGMVSIIGY